MSGTMSKADLIADLKAMLMDTAGKFTAAADADFGRHLDIAALDIGRFRPRTYLATLTLVADQDRYAAPADLVEPKYALWGVSERGRILPWERGYPGRLPALTLGVDATGRFLRLDPAPTAAQIAAFGATYRFYYFQAHAVADAAANTTVHPGHRAALLVRACAAAALELANAGVTKPVQFHNGMQGTPNSGTPLALHEALMEQFEGMLA